MDYEKKYKSLVEAVKVLKETNPSDEGIQNWVKDNVPELKENEDERIRKALILHYQGDGCISTYEYRIDYKEIRAWLEKQELKKMEQNPTWSEEDERLFQIVIDILDRGNHLGNISRTDLIACVRKLKSLRPQNRWKPSDEQMEVLDMILTNESIDDNIARILCELKEQLTNLTK